MTKFLTIALAVGLIFLGCGTAAAFPGADQGDCTACHNNSGLEYEATPDLLTIEQGGTGQFDFDILAIPDESANALAVRGLDNPMLGLAADPPGWTNENPSGNQYYQRFPVVGIVDTIPLELNIGLLAEIGDYPITVQFVGKGQTGVTADGGFLNLTVRVVPIPEPTTLVLTMLGIGCAGFCFWRRKRAP